MAGRRDAGFTLVEVLVVVAVIAIASAFVTINLYGDDRRATEREALRMAGALEHAAALAQWRSETLGVSADGTGYRFWRRGADGRWTAVQDDDVLAPRALPAQWTIAPVSYASAPVAADVILPFRPSGRNEPYALLLASPAWSLVVAGDPLNRVAVAAQAASR
ncbi:MAG: prepilin-type N-terminal cleavage/methylation domain-containing protein [Betaproteobacteria bacterium]